MFTARARRLLRCTGSRHSAGQGKAWQQGVGSGAATRQLQQYLSDPAAPAAFAKTHCQGPSHGLAALGPIGAHRGPSYP